MDIELHHWRKDWMMMGAFFTTEQTGEIYSRLTALKPLHLAFCALESRFARSGGLAAVTAKEIPFLKHINHFKKACLISPCYPTIMSAAPLQKSEIAFAVPFAGKSVPVQVYTYQNEYQEPQPGTVMEYFIRAPGFFEAQNRLKDPYLYYADDPLKNDAALRENALFYVAAVPHLLAAIGWRTDTIVHAQDWQAALITLTVKQAMCDENPLLQAAAVVITMHNPYDSYFPATQLDKILTPPLRKRVAETKIEGWTAFEIGLALVDGPTATVSEHFARELASDPIQVEHFAPHLQTSFRRGTVRGVNNGLFVPFSPDFPLREQHTLQQIAEIKQHKREQLLKILATYTPPQRFGELSYQGQSILTLPDAIPILFMNGRLDPVQKGYDVLLRAVERFGRDEIKLVLAPMPVQEEDLDLFHQIASKCRGDITVFPIRMEKGFQELLSGSTFGLMPSIYEPFGAALDYMANGTAVIARNTGGLTDQIINEVNGLLWREVPDHYTAANIKAFAAGARVVQMRKFNPWMGDMIDALHRRLLEAKVLYQMQRQVYHKIIRQGFLQAGKFSWEKTARQYGKIYACVRR